MKMFALGFLTCFVIMTVGFAGLANMGDNLMSKGQAIVKEAAQ